MAVHLSKGDAVTYVGLVTVAVLEALEPARKEALMSPEPHPFLSWSGWNYLPIILLTLVAVIWLWKALQPRITTNRHMPTFDVTPPGSASPGFSGFFKGRRDKGTIAPLLNEALHLCRVEVRFSDLHSGQFEVDFHVFNGSDSDIAFNAVKGSVKFFGIIGGEGKGLETLQPSGAMSGFDAVVRPMEECRVVVSQSFNKPSLEAVKQGFASGQGFWLKLDGLQLIFAPVSTPDRKEALTIWPSIECYQSAFGVHVTKYIQKSGTFVMPESTAQMIKGLRSSES